MQQNGTRLFYYSRNKMGMKEGKNRRQWSEHRRARVSSTCTQPIQGRWAHGKRDSEGVVWWWEE